MFDKLLHYFWAYGVDLFLYAILLVVTLKTVRLMIEQPVKQKVSQLKNRSRLRKVRQPQIGIGEKQYKTALGRHIYFLVKTTSTEKKDHDTLAFTTVTILLATASFAITFLNFNDLFFSFVMSLLVAFIPYLLLQVKLRSLRFTIGNDLLSVVQALAQNYNSIQHDMYFALVQTSKGIQNRKLKNVFVKLISDLQVARNEEELRESIELFTYTAGSSWATRLGNIILKAYLYDEKVLDTLLILSRQIEETEAMLEEEKSHTMDTVFNGFLTIPIFIASIILAYYVTGPQDYVTLQFREYWSLFFFFTSVVMIFLSIIISLILRKPKNDI